MRRAGGVDPGARKRSSRQTHPRAPHHPKTAGTPRPSPPVPLERGGCRTPPAQARHVIFEDEVRTLGRPPKKAPPIEEGKKGGASSVSPPRVTPRGPPVVPDYVVKYPAIRSHRQREGYKGVFQDQLEEYKELLGVLRGGVREPEKPPPPPRRTDWAFLEKQQRCQYLKKKLTHIKARIQEYDHDGAVYF